MSPQRRSLALILAGLLVLVGWFLVRRPSRPLASTSPSASAKAAALDSPPAPADLPAPASVAAMALPARPPSGRADAAAGSAAVSVDMFRDVIAANSAPGRILFLDFVLDRGGLRLVSASGAAGRAKPAAPREGFGFVHYEVFGPGNDLLLSGSVEDPTRRRIEHPAASNDGRIESTTEFNDAGPLSVRLPGELAAARIVFFRDKNPLAPSPQGRENLGEFILRPSP